MKQFTDLQKLILKQQWSIEGEIVFHREVANKVYFCHRAGREVVLRLTEAHHRKPEEIESELDWAFYLSTHGMSIAAPIQSSSGKFCVEFDGFFASVFEKAEGTSLDLKTITKDQIINWGQYLGKMHALTKHYSVQAHLKKRQEWREDASLTMALRSFDPKDSIPYKRMNELLEWMAQLPKGKNEYGLLHCDLHSGNFFVHEAKMTAFDFDDCCYHWFSYDFTPPLFSIGMNEENLETFLEGYQKENILEEIWIKRIPLFYQFRKALLYYWLQTAMREKNLSPKHIEWAKENFPLIKQELSEKILFI